MKKHRIPGAALALVHEGAVVAERGFGVLRRGETAPVESATVFQVASVSKPVTVSTSLATWRKPLSLSTARFPTF